MSETVAAWVPLEGTKNTRDLGGLPTRDGRRFRRGVLLRSDALDALTTADVGHLVDIVGLRHVIDLRSASERAERGRGLLGEHPIGYTEFDVIDTDDFKRRSTDRQQRWESGDDPAVIMADGYIEFLDDRGAQYVELLRQIVEPDVGSPVLVHCTVGKDRTGVLVALLLAAADVEPASIIADYAATAERLDGLRERLAGANRFKEVAAKVPAFVLDADAKTMELLLAHLDDVWGGATNYLLRHGADASLIDAWRQLATET